MKVETMGRNSSSDGSGSGDVRGTKGRKKATTPLVSLIAGGVAGGVESGVTVSTSCPLSVFLPSICTPNSRRKDGFLSGEPVKPGWGYGGFGIRVAPAMR